MRTSSRRLLWWTLGFVVWTALALLEIVQTAMALSHRGAAIDWPALAFDRLADWYSYGVFIPPLLIATRRWPLDRRHLPTRLPLHLAAAVVVVVARTIIVRPLMGEWPRGSLSTVLDNMITESIAVAALIGVLHAIEFYRRYRERELLALQLRASLSDARLHALRAQLQPHFLFNTLNAATALLYSEPRSADRMLTQLADLLRMTLRLDVAHETTLREEMALLDRYLAIMRVRFGDRVSVECRVSPNVLDALVPAFLLQPIVENAFEHGVSAVTTAGHIAIAAVAHGNTLLLTVRDNGPGVAEEPRTRGGLGLANTRRRLAELYGDRASLTLSGVAGRGTLVEIRVPFATERAAA